MKFVMDTSKYWFKPSITRDQGKARVSLLGSPHLRPAGLLPVPQAGVCSPHTSVPLSPALSSCGDPVVAIQSIRGVDGHGETHGGRRLRNTGCATAPLSPLRVQQNFSCL